MPPTPPANAPLIVQSDFSILADIHAPDYEAVRPLLARFAELERSPEHIHFYRISPLSLWNAAAAGMTLEEIVDVLGRYSRFTLPSNVVTDLAEYLGRYGKLVLLQEEATLLLYAEDGALLDRVAADERIAPMLGRRRSPDCCEVLPGWRGDLKQALVELGYPPHDRAGYVDGARLEVELLPATHLGHTFQLRAYQKEAVDAFYAQGSADGGSGVIVLPCGAGKTIVGLGVMHAASTHTLILCPNTVAVRQWIAEILDKTTLRPDEVGEYSAERKEIRPVTVATYQIMTYRPFAVDESTGEVGDFPHMRLLRQSNWGLLIYDEVHLLPAPVF
ncbi:MAG TPA: helicase-associated domain-containing protein, partial [Herpetosiphonaceae bacterium]|nr:helicase-associated domain-containing protein [Herpetosiphonaceae bacterium]